MANDLKYIPLSQIRENPVALRPVDKTSEEYKGLVASIRQDGVLNAISVREVPNPEGTEPRYAVVDGLHRFTAAGDAGLAEIPAKVVSFDDAKVLEAQIVANIHKVETKPAQYSKQLARMMSMNPMLTVAELAARLSKSSTWLIERLGLVKLTEAIQKLVDGGQIKISNAIALAKLPPEKQADFVDRAMTQTPGEFVPACQAAVKAHREALRAGKDPNAAPTFQPVAFLQKLGDIKAAVESPNALATELITKAGATNPVDAFALGLKWALHMDPVSIEQQKIKWEANEAAKAKKKADAAAERAKKAQDAAATAAVAAGA